MKQHDMLFEIRTAITLRHQLAFRSQKKIFNNLNIRDELEYSTFEFFEMPYANSGFFTHTWIIGM